MEAINENTRRKIIGNFYENNKNKGKPFTVHHFMKMGISRSTIYSIIKRIDNQITLERKPGSGKMSPNKEKKIIIKLIQNTVGEVSKSYKKLGKIFQISENTVKSKLNQLNIIKKKRKIAPKSSESQKLSRGNA